MFWLRPLFLFIPALLMALVGWVTVQVKAGQRAQQSELVALLPEGLALPLQPYAPSSDVEAQIVDLLHEPLVRLDASGHIAPALAIAWQWSKSVSLGFASPQQAQQALIKIQEVKAQQWAAWQLTQAKTIGDMLQLDFESPQQANAAAAVQFIATMEPQLLTMIRLQSVEGHSMDSVLAEPRLAKQILRQWRDSTGAIEIAIRSESKSFARDISELCLARQIPRPGLRSLAKLLALDEPVLTFKLDSAARWHDGRPVTALDVQQTWLGLRQEPALLSFPRPGLQRIDRIEVSSPETLTARVVYRVPYGPALCDWIHLPILPASWWQAQAARTAHARLAFTPPLGAGPLRIEHRDSSRLILRPAAKPAPDALQRLSLMRHHSAFATHLGAATGALDVLWPGNASLAELPRHDEFRFLQAPPRTQTTVLWNTRRGPLAEPLVRAAIALGTNRADLVATLLHGCGTPFTGIFAPGLWLSSQPTLPTCDVPCAEALLAQAGYLKGINGVASRPGAPLSIELLIDATQPRHSALADALARQWLALGITTRIIALPDAGALAERLAQRHFDAVLTIFELNATWDILARWHSSGDSPTGQNFTGLHDRQIDIQLEALVQEYDPKAAASRAQKLEATLLAQHPLLPLFCAHQPLAIRHTKAPASPADDHPWSLRQLFASPSRSLPEGNRAP